MANGKSVSLEQVAEKTKISIRFLRAIEAGDFAQLPGGIFALNYVRQYAEAKGVDPERLLRQYQAFIAPQPAKRIDTECAEPRTLLGRLFKVPA